MSEIENDQVYVVPSPFGGVLGFFVRTGEQFNRVYHVHDSDQTEIGHVTRYRYVEGIMLILLRDSIVASQTGTAEFSDADLEKFVSDAEFSKFEEEFKGRDL